MNNLDFFYKSISEAQAEAKAEQIRKQQYAHDWKIALFSTIGGAFAGFITSLIFWLITK